MKNKLFFLGVFILIFTTSVFAEEVQVDKPIGLKDSDVKSFIKNYKQLNKDFESYGVFLNASTAASALGGLTAEKSLQSILNKNGISGTNALEKFYRIYYYSVIVIYDKEIEKTIAENPAIAAYLAAANADPYAEVRKTLCKPEFEIIKANGDELLKVLNSDDDN